MACYYRSLFYFNSEARIVMYNSKESALGPRGIAYWFKLENIQIFPSLILPLKFFPV